VYGWWWQKKFGGEGGGGYCVGMAGHVCVCGVGWGWGWGWDTVESTHVMLGVQVSYEMSEMQPRRSTHACDVLGEQGGEL
jgi:hypothetical protein